MAASLSTIKERFKAFRNASEGRTGKQLRYPQELLKLIFEAKESGVTYEELMEASGLSEGGLNKIVTRFRKGDVGRRGPGRPPKVEMTGTKSSRSVISKVGGKKSSAPKHKVTTGKAAAKEAKASRSRITAVKSARKTQKTYKKMPKLAKVQKTVKKHKTTKVAKSLAKTSKAAAITTGKQSSNIFLATTAKKRGRPSKDSQQVEFTVQKGGEVWNLKMGAKDIINVIRQLGAA